MITHRDEPGVSSGLAHVAAVPARLLDSPGTFWPGAFINTVVDASPPGASLPFRDANQTT